jgi:hypothetical protein
LTDLLALAGVVLALAALFRAISLHRRLTTLSQSYWELRYDFGRLRARLAKLDGGTAADADEPSGGNG